MKKKTKTTPALDTNFVVDIVITNDDRGRKLFHKMQTTTTTTISHVDHDDWKVNFIMIIVKPVPLEYFIFSHSFTECLLRLTRPLDREPSQIDV